MPPTTQQRQDAGRQFGRDLDIENDTRRESGLAPLTTQRAPEGTQVVETGSVPASSLAAPVSRVNVPAPVENIVQPARGIDAVRDNLTFDIQEFRTNQAQERENFQQLQALGGGESFIDARTRLTQESGMVANQTRLQDIQTQLAGLSTESLGTRVNIASEAGATGATSQRAMSAEQSKNNVRSFGLAAEASILQGNIESARTFVNDAISTIYQDRQLGRQNLIDQNNALSNILDPQRAEILQQDNRRYEEEIAATQRVQSAVDLAMQSGATADDVKRMTDPTLTDEDRLATAQGIVARGATQDRALDIQAQESQLATQAAQRANIFDQISSRKVAAREKASAQTEAGQEAADKKVADSEQALEIKRLAEELGAQPGGAGAVGFGLGKSVRGAIPFASGDAFAGTNRADFEALAGRLANLLTLDNLDLMSGVLSETDIKILETSGSNLKNFDMSEEAYTNEVRRIISVMDRTIENNGITADQARFYGVANDEELSEIDLIFNAE